MEMGIYRHQWSMTTRSISFIKSDDFPQKSAPLLTCANLREQKGNTSYSRSWGFLLLYQSVLFV